MSNEKNIANNDQPAGTGGHFEPETRIISQAMYVLAEEIQSGDGVANAACRQAAERLDAQTVEIERLRAALRTPQEPVGVVESAVQGCNGFHVKLRPGQDTPRIGTKLYAAPPVVQWTAADDTEGGEV